MKFAPLASLVAPMVFAAAAFSPATAGTDYVVALSKGSSEDTGWKKAADALATKNHGKVIVWDETESGLSGILRENQPRYLGIIGKPETFSASMVRGVNRATRTAADPDLWTDCRWGMITGATPEAALKLIETNEPLTVKRALCTTGIKLDAVESALVLSDGAPGKYTLKVKDGKPEEKTWDEKAEPEGTVKMFANAWNAGKPQLLVTSSHATQFNLEMPFSLGLIASHGGKFHLITKAQHNQFARFLGGAMFTGDVKKLGNWIESINAPVLGGGDDPKVWLAAGNCLIGDARKTNESMVVSALSSAGVRQMVGYVVPTWYGKNGWGALETWQNSSGGLTLSEAFYLNTQSLIDRTSREFPGAEKVNFDSDDISQGLKGDRGFLEGLKKLEDAGVLKQENSKDVLGLIHDRDVVAFWGDPRWEARFAIPAEGAPLDVKWETRSGNLVMVLTARRDYDGQWSAWLPQRVSHPVVNASKPAQDILAAKDFILFRKLKLAKGETLKVELKPGA